MRHRVPWGGWSVPNYLVTKFRKGFTHVGSPTILATGFQSHESVIIRTQMPMFWEG